MKLSITNIVTTIGIALLLVSCQAKKAVVTTQPTKQQPAQPTWHTRLTRNAQAIASIDNQTYQAKCSMWAVNDSLTIISVQPMLGIEMFRLEATPKTIVVIDKINHQYVQTDYAEINRFCRPKMKYTLLQEIAVGKGDIPERNQADYTFAALGKTLTLHLAYPATQTDVPINTHQQDVTKYQKQTIAELLK